MYSREERMKAVKLYFQYDRQVAPVLRELGYPSRGALRRWVAEFEATGDVHAVFVTVLLHKLVCQLAPGRLRRLASSHELWPAGVVHAPRSRLLASRLAPSDRSSTDKRASISLATRSLGGTLDMGLVCSPVFSSANHFRGTRPFPFYRHSRTLPKRVLALLPLLGEK